MKSHERKVYLLAMRRFRIWKRENPGGLIPWGKVGHVEKRSGYDMIRACFEAEKAERKK